MIKSFRHKGLEKFFNFGITKGVKAEHVKKLRQILTVLNVTTQLEDIESVITFKCHRLTGKRNGEYSIWVNKNWRVTFVFDGNDICLVIPEANDF